MHAATASTGFCIIYRVSKKVFHVLIGITQEGLNLDKKERYFQEAEINYSFKSIAVQKTQYCYRKMGGELQKRVIFLTFPRELFEYFPHILVLFCVN